jgi:hypothetical protein
VGSKAVKNYRFVKTVTKTTPEKGVAEPDTKFGSGGWIRTSDCLRLGAGLVFLAMVGIMGVVKE